jgi:wingless-type MMTV integration site family protein 1
MDLVYYEASPSFCAPDSSVGFMGTIGRTCNASSIGVDGCDLMCCGRGYTTEEYVAKERCNCVFHWCCKVTCDTCRRTRLRHICK